jgi:hypothetical protein
MGSSSGAAPQKPVGSKGHGIVVSQDAYPAWGSTPLYPEPSGAPEAKGYVATKSSLCALWAIVSQNPSAQNLTGL